MKLPKESAMTALCDFQQALCQAALGQSDRSIAAKWVVKNDPQDRLSIHRNNTLLGLTDVLTGIYPVILRLVGEDFFAMLASDFIRQHPPRHSALLFWGRDLPAFLQTYAPAQSLPYLADMARLETAWYTSYHAAEAASIAPEALLDIPPDNLEQALFTLHPTLHLMASPFPILTIWHANQPENPDDDSIIDLAQGAATLAVIRPDAQVLIHNLTPGSFAFLLALQCGQSLGTSWEAAKMVQPNFSLIQELGALLAGGFFTKVTLP